MQLQTIPNAPKYCETDRNISLESTRVDWCVRREKSRRDLVSRTFVLTAPVQYVLHQFDAVKKRSQMHRNTMKQTETLVWGPTGWIVCVRCEKSDGTSRHQLLH